MGFLLLAALEQLLARLLNSAVAPPTGVAGALADLLEVRPDEGVPRPELRATALLALAGVGSGQHLLPQSVRVVLAQARLHP